jgi:hypothetical protein
LTFRTSLSKIVLLHEDPSSQPEETRFLNAKADLPAERAPSQEDARISREDENERRPKSTCGKTAERAGEAYRLQQLTLERAAKSE